MSIPCVKKKTRPLAAALFLILLMNAPVAEAFRIGRVDVMPRLNLEGVYDDNIFLRSGGDPDNPIQDEWFGRVSPSVALSYDHAPTTFSTSYSNEFLVNDRLDQRSNYGRNHRFTFSVAHAYGERTSLSVDDFLLVGTDVADISEEGLEDVEQTGLLPRQRDFRMNRAGVTVSHTLTRRVGITGSGEYGYSWYDSVVQGGVEEEASTEEHNGSVTLSTSFAWRPDNSVNVSVGATYNDYDERGHSTSFLASVGDSWRATQTLSLSASGGIEYLQQTRELGGGTGGEVEEESIHPYGSLNGTYILREEVSVTGSLSYSLSDSSGIGGTVSSRSGRLGLNYNPRSDLAIRFFGFYSRSESAGDGTLDLESIQGGGSIRYEVFHWASAYFNYNYIHQESFGEGAGTEGESYEDNRVVLGCSLTLPETIR